MKKKVLVISNSFPNPEKPHWGIFIGQTVQCLSDYYLIEVIKPIPYFPKARIFSRFKDWHIFAKLPREWFWNGILVNFPRFPVIPRFFQMLHPVEVAFSILNLLIRKKKSRSFDLIHAHYLFPEGIAAVILGRILRIPVVISARGTDLNVEAAHYFKSFQIKWALRNADAATALTRDLYNKMIQLGAGKANTFLVPNGVNIKKFYPVEKDDARKMLGLDDQYKIVLFTGRLHEVKGILFLLEALLILKKEGGLNFKTFLLGDGPQRGEIEKYIMDNSLDKDVTLLGMKRHELIPAWMSAADLLCLPSLSEGQPNVVMEALACGTPVIGSRVGGIPDLVSCGNGLLFNPGDPLDLARVLEKSLSTDWNREDIFNSVAGLSWEKTTQHYMDIYERLLAQKKYGINKRQNREGLLQ